MRRSHVIGVALLLFLLLIVGFMFLHDRITRPINGTNDSRPCTHPPMQPANEHFHMITPHLCSIPTFTTDDVRQYVNTHAFDDLRIDSVGQPVVTKIAFMTSQQLSVLLNQSSTGDNLTSIMCYVELQGNFVFYSSFSSPKENIGIVFEVIDGLTGNVVESGSRASTSPETRSTRG